MREFITFKTAVWLNNKGIIIDSDYCYCISRIGVRAVKGDPTNPIAEREWHRGTIEKFDINWGIQYPSENWVSCPYVLETIIYLQDNLDIIFVPIYSDHKWGCKVLYNDNEILYKEPFIKGFELMYKNVLDSLTDNKNDL